MSDERTHPDKIEPLDVSDLTPEAAMTCRECGDTLVQILEDWRPPETADAAWDEWKTACVAVGQFDQFWTFCRRTGGCWVGEERRDFERRKTPALDPYQGDRRRLRPLRSRA